MPTSKVYTKGKVDELLAAKADASDTYSKAQVDSAVGEVAGNLTTEVTARTALEKRVVKLENFHIKTYGITFTGNATEGVRILDAAGLTWNKSDGGLCDFADLPIFKDIQLVELPALDSSGNAVTSAAVNKMMFIPNIYDASITSETVEGQTVTTLKFSSEGKKPLFRKADGTAATGGLIGCYLATTDGNNVYGSFTNKQHVYSVDRSTAQSRACYIQSDDWGLELQQLNMNFPKEAWDLLYYLMVLVIGNRNTQYVFQSRTKTGSRSETSGVTDSISGLFGEINTGEFKVFGVENYYGNLWTVLGGIGVYNSKFYLAPDTTLAKQKDNTTFVEETAVGATVPAAQWNYTTEMETTANGVIIPKTYSGSDSTYYADGVYGSATEASWHMVPGGGDYDGGAAAGASCSYCYRAWAYSSVSIGFRAFVLVP